MKNEGLASIIMPAYNHENFIEFAIESVLNQSYPNIELLCSDDHSSDGTLKIIKNAAKQCQSRVKFIQGTKNRGVAYRWTQLLNMAKGDYIIPFASDDLLPEHAIRDRIFFLTQNPDVDVVVTDFDVLNESESLFRGFQKLNIVPQFGRLYSINWEYLYDELIKGNFIPGGAICIKLQRIGKDEVFQDTFCPNLSDYELWLRLALKYKWAYCSKSTWRYRWHGQNFSSMDNPDNSRKAQNAQYIYIMGKQLLMSQNDIQKTLIYSQLSHLCSSHNKNFIPRESTGIRRTEISIVIVTYNSYKEIDACIESILKNTCSSFEIIVVDNCSTDGTRNYLLSRSDVRLIFNKKNLGFSKGTNIGIRKAKGEYIVFLNPDTVVSHGWDKRLMCHFCDGVGAVGPLSNYVAGLQKIQLYLCEDSYKQKSIYEIQELLSLKYPNEDIDTKLLIGFCLLTHRTVLEKVGLLDEELFLGNDDLDLSLRLRKAGFKLKIALDTFVYHKGQASFESKPSTITEQLVQESTDILFKKLLQQYSPEPVPSSQKLWGINWFKPSADLLVRNSFVSIVILSCNGRIYTQQCIESIIKHTDTPYEIILVDNGSTDDTANYLNELEKFTDTYESVSGKQKYLSPYCRRLKTVRLNKNTGFAAGNNVGISKSRGEYVLLINNDVVVTPGWLSKLLLCAIKHPQSGIVGPRTNYVSGPQLLKNIHYNVDTLEGLEDFSRSIAEKYSSTYRKLLRVVGFCMLIKRDVVKKIGGLDDRYGLGNFEDDDFSIRATLAGFESWMAEDCFIHHYGSRTFIGEKIDYRKSLKKNWNRFKEKWGLPQELSYTTGYNWEQLNDRHFLPEIHYIPVDKQSTRRNAVRETYFQDSMKLYEGIQALFGKGQNENAFQKLKQLVKSDPKFAPAHNDLGVLFHRRGDKEQSLTNYRNAVRLQPDNTTYLKNLADLLSVEFGEIEESIELYINVLKLDPNDLEALTAMATICTEMGREEDAVFFWDRVLDIEPGSSAALSFINSHKSEKTEKRSSEIIDKKYLQLKSRTTGLKPEDLIPQYEEFLNENQCYSHAYNDLGALYHLVGDRESALKNFRQAVEIDPQNKEFSKNLADYLFTEMKQTQSAVDIYKRILDTFPDDIESRMMLGHLSTALKRYDEAEKHYHHVLGIEPNHPDAVKFFRALNKMPESQESVVPFRHVGMDQIDIPSNGKLGLQSGAGKDKDSRPLTSIIILLTGSRGRLKRCLSSIQENTRLPYELLLVDCGVGDGIKKLVKGLASNHDHIHILNPDVDASFPVALNSACEKAGGESIAILHSDVVVGQDWLDGLIGCAKFQEKVGIVGAMTANADVRQKALAAADVGIKNLNEFSLEYGRKFGCRRILLEQVNGCCFWFYADLIRRIGGFDENYRSETYTLKDFCLRAALLGMQNIAAGSVYVHHDDKHGTHHFDSNECREEDRAVYTAKWEGFEPDGPVVKALQARRIYREGIRKFHEGKVHAAVDCFLKGIGRYPNDPGVYLSMADLLKNAGHYQEALEAIEETPESQSTSKRLQLCTLTLKGYCMQGLGNNDEAETLVSQVLENAPTYAPALNLKGILAYKKGSTNTAVELFRQSMQSDPGYGEAYTNLGVVYWDRDEKEQAFEWLERGFILNPLDIDISNLFQAAVVELGKFDSAETVVLDAAGIYPENKRLQFMAADLLIHLCKYSEAIAIIEKAIVRFGFDDDILAAALEIRQELELMTIKERSKEHPSVSLCMIVKNEEQYLARCLHSVKPIVDEMIVVDTGSDDHTREIAKLFGAKVFDYQWDDDFAAARNFSLSKASGDWVLVMDADEVISQQDHMAFRKLLSKRRKTPCAYSVVTRNYNSEINIVGWVPNSGQYPAEEAGTGWLASTKVRLFPRDERIRFDGAVHEMVESALERCRIPTKRCAIPVHHYGRLDKESLDRKGVLYYEIGRKKLETVGDDPRALRELAVQATILKKNEEALRLWKRLLELDIDAANQAYAHVNVGTIYSRMGRFEEALEMAELAKEEQPNMKEAHYNLAMAQLHLGFADKTVKTLENLLQRFPDYPPAQFVLTAAYGCCGRTDDFELEIEKLKRSSFGNALVLSFVDLAKGLIQAKMVHYARDILEAAIGSGLSNPEMADLHASLNNKPNVSGFGNQYPGAQSAVMNSGL